MCRPFFCDRNSISEEACEETKQNKRPITLPQRQNIFFLNVSSCALSSMVSFSKHRNNLKTVFKCTLKQTKIHLNSVKKDLLV